MKQEIISEGKFHYIEVGEGTPIIVLHGLMGGLSNFDGVTDFFPEKEYKVVVPELPLYKMSLRKTSLKTLAKYVKGLIDFKNYKEVILLGNSLGGHIALLTAKLYPEKIKAMAITGSSGLYESAMGESYPRRGDYEFIKKKAEEVFYNPEVATKELVEEVFETVNDRNKLIRTLAISKTAIRHNMSKDLPKMTIPTCIIWGKQDQVTPPDVAVEFDRLLPNSDLYWIDKCGHAPMMEHPKEFNQILFKWLSDRNL